MTVSWRHLANRPKRGGAVPRAACAGDDDSAVSGKVGQGSRRVSANERVVYAALVAVVAFAAPVLLIWSAEPGFGLGSLLPVKGRVGWSGQLLPFAAALVIPPFVFQLLSRRSPAWTYGSAFGVIPATTSAVTVGVLERHDLNATVFVFALFAFVATFLVSMVGASVASLVARLFDPETQLRRPQRLQPWHLGAAVAAVEMIAVVVAAVTDF
jgi:hypothetical protein